MNVTFLIGNGFDLNLGLKTAYSDFAEYYKGTSGTTENLKKFRQHIKDNEKLWSAAEIAFGEYTSQFAPGEAEAFSECQVDFCEHLADYLKEQERRFDYESSQEAILKSFAHINEIAIAFPTQERAAINEIFQKRKAENVVFNFISFNYTTTLDKCLDIVKKEPTVLGSHKNVSQIFNHSIGRVYHVHGTVDKEMVFGVHDDSQIAKPEVFDCEEGALYKNLLIKERANASYLENTDLKVSELIKNSHLIYIYGMSIGDTDKLWWSRICLWLSANPERHLIIHKHKLPKKSVIPARYQVAERKAQQEFIKHSGIEEVRISSFEQRIHITSENLFKDMSGCALFSAYSMYATARKELLTKTGNKEKKTVPT